MWQQEIIALTVGWLQLYLKRALCENEIVIPYKLFARVLRSENYFHHVLVIIWENPIVPFLDDSWEENGEKQLEALQVLS